MLFLFSSLVILSLVFVYILAISFTMWMIVDAAKNDRFWWVVLTIAIPLIGSAVYYFTEKRKMYSKLEKPPVASHAHHEHSKVKPEETPKESTDSQ